MLVRFIMRVVVVIEVSITGLEITGRQLIVDFWRVLRSVFTLVTKVPLMKPMLRMLFMILKSRVTLLKTSVKRCMNYGNVLTRPLLKQPVGLRTLL